MSWMLPLAVGFVELLLALLELAAPLLRSQSASCTQAAWSGLVQHVQRVLCHLHLACSRQPQPLKDLLQLACPCSPAPSCLYQRWPLHMLS